MDNQNIKEILDNFKIYEERYKKCNETQFIIFYRDIHLLLDYITNLQEKYERMKENAGTTLEELGYEYKYLPNSHRIEFFKDKDEEMHFVYNEIIFNKKFKTIKIKGYFNLEELQAINKQVEELGWNNER